jgi:uncharacterized membrane protein YgcG
MKTLFLLMGLLILLPARVWAEDAGELQGAMIQAGFSTDQISRVQSIVTTARQSGVPGDVVTSKVYEGMAKHVSPDRIITALEKVTSRYEYGYSLAAKIGRNKEQITGLGNMLTAGIAAGLTRQDAEQIVNRLQSRAPQVEGSELYQLAEESIRAARDMSRQGVSSATTVNVVGTAIQKGYAARDMQTMRSTFNRQAAAASHETLARGYSNAIGRGAQATDLSGIGPGNRGGNSPGTGTGGSGGGAGGGNSGGGGGRR